MTACVAAPNLPWSFSVEDENRFRRILRTSLVVFLVFGLVMPLLPLPEINKTIEEELPPRMAKLLLQEKPPLPKPKKPEPVVQKPKPLPKKVEAPKPVPKKRVVAKPKPVPVKPKPTARQQAEKSGLLALKDSLADLRQNTVASSLKQSRALSHSGGQARKTERAILTSGTTRGSDGIRTASMSRNTGGGALAGRATTQVHSPTGNAPPAQTVGGKGKGDRQAGRSIEEIQMVFDRNKGAIYSVYNRALRKDPTLQGKVVLQLTIAPSGKVTMCKLVSSELHDAALGQKISQRVKLFDFGAKDVETVTITYPIDFLPA